MKIELTCPHCESVLRIDAGHAGKQARCPSCQNLTLIPSDSAPVEETIPYAKQLPPEDDSPYSPPPEYVNASPPQQVSTDDTISLVLGIVGIVMNIGCGCLFPAWLVLNLIGFYKAMGIYGPMKTACIVTNGIGLALGLFKFIWFFGFGFLTFMF